MTSVATIALTEEQAVQARPYLRGWSHLLAFVGAVAICPLAIVFSPAQRPAVALYTGVVVGLFAISGAYHVLFWGTRAHELFRRLDHAMIFITIAASYTPVVLFAVPQPGRAIMLIVVWAGSIAGAVTQLSWPHSPRWLTVSLYVAVGWAILPSIGSLWESLGAAGFTLLLLGGVLHTAGALIYATNRPNPWPAWFGFHEVFHLFVVAAIASHYVLIAVLISP